MSQEEQVTTEVEQKKDLILPEYSHEDVIALFFAQHEKSLPVPISRLGLRELRRVLMYALFGELGKKTYNPKTDHERKLGYGIRQAFAERTIMEAVQQELQIEAAKSKLEPIVNASDVLPEAIVETSQTNNEGVNHGK